MQKYNMDVIRGVNESLGSTLAGQLMSHPSQQGLAFYTYSEAEDYFTMCFLTLISIWSVVGNMLVMFVFFKQRNLRTPTNFYILSLCIADFVVGVYVVNFYIFYIAKRGWHLGKAGCTAWLLIDYGVYQASIFGVVIITIDRFLLIKYPFIKHTRTRTASRVRLVIFVSWLLSFSVWLPAIVYFDEDIEDITSAQDCGLPFNKDKCVTLATTFISYVAPVALISFIACHTYYLLLKSKRVRNQSVPSRIDSREIKLDLINCEPEGSESPGRQKRKGTLASLASVPGSFQSQRKLLKGDSIDSEYGVEINTPRPSPDEFDKGWSYASFKQKTRNISNISVTSARRVSCAVRDRLSRTRFISKREAEVRKISRFVLLMAVAFMVTILPFGVLSIIRVFSEEGVDDRLWRASCILAYLNSALNPLCYAFGNKNFNIALRQLLCRFRSRETYVSIRK